MSPRARAGLRAPLSLSLCVVSLALARSDSALAESPKAAADTDGATVRASGELSTYLDSDHVTVISPTVSLGMEDPVRGWSASGRYLVDVVSAASADIVATASPRWREVRHAASVEGSYKPNDFGLAPRASFSREPDYLSLGTGLQLSQDFDEKAWTAAGGYGYGHDTISRKNTPFSVFSRTLDRHSFNLSASAIVDRTIRVTVIADLVLERGYLAKPYRYVPTFEPNVTVPSGATVDQINALRANERVAENVPDKRDRMAVTVRVAKRLPGLTLRADERLYTDTWGMLASTTDLRAMHDLTPALTVWPHVRGHVQRGVTFYRRTYEVITDEGNVRRVPTFITGNREHGPARALTLGGGASWALGPETNRNKWKASFMLDGIATWYTDSLFLERRYGVFSALTLDATFE